MSPSAFTLKLGDGQKRVSIETLKEALENALAMLRSVGEEFTPVGVEVRWEVVAASLESPLTLTFAPRVKGKAPGARGIGKRIAVACLNGIDQLQDRAELPDHFNEDAIEATRKLIRVAQKDKAKLTVGADHRQEVTLTEQAVEHIDRVVEKARAYTDEGTIEGRLEEISIHGGPHVGIWDELTDLRVNCIIGEDRLEAVMALLGKRVAASGPISYRNHRAVKIVVEDIRPLRGWDQIIKLEDMPPIDITGGLSSEEYIRGMRDAQ